MNSHDSFRRENTTSKSLCLSVSPPITMEWLSLEEKNRNILLFDFEADLIIENKLRLDLNVVFNPIPIKRGKTKRADHYIGSTGAEIIVETENGKIGDHTQEVKLKVNYNNTNTRKRNSALNITPTIKMKGSSNEINASLGAITRGAGEDSSFSAAFSSEERQLVPVVMDNRIRWLITLPRGEKIVRDFLIGNLYLFVECLWAKSVISGSFNVRPSDVLFFDETHRPMGRRKSIMMEYFLWRKGFKLMNKDGFRIEFEETS